MVQTPKTGTIPTTLARLSTAFVLSVVMLIAQEPAETPTSTPTEITERDQNGSSHQSNATNDENQPTTPERSTQENSESEPINQSSALPWWLTALGTLLVPVLTCLLVVVAVLQFRLAKVIYYATHRPRLRVRNVVVPSFEKLNEETPMSEVEKAFQQGLAGSYFDVANIGSTQGTLVYCDVKIHFAENLRMARPHGDGSGIQIMEKIKIAGGESRRLKIPNPGPLDPEQIARFTVRNIPPPLKDNSINAYLIGVMKYRDGNDVVRETAICRKFNNSTVRFEPVDDPDYSYED